MLWLRGLLLAVCGTGLFVLNERDACGFQPEEHLPESVVAGERFEALQFTAEQIPAPEATTSKEETILAPDQPGNIDLGAGQRIDGLGDQSDTVLDPNQVGNLMTRLDALEHQGDELPIIRLSGFFQLDDGLYSQNARALAYFGDMQDGVGFRRARLQAIGKLTEFTAFTIEMDFAQPGRPSFVDVWGEKSDLPFFGTIRIGQFRQPGTMDSWTSIRHLNFLERSAAFQALDPFRRIGIMAYGLSEDERTSWAYSVYGTGLTFWNGASTTYKTFGDNQYGAQIGDNGGVSFSSRITHLVHYDEPSDGRYLLHVGGGYLYSQLGGEGATGPFAKAYNSSTFPEFFVGDPNGGGVTAAGTPLVLNTGRFLADDFSLYHLELAANRGPFNFQSEVMLEPVNQRGGPIILQTGAYMQCGYFLTGEHANYLKQAGVFDYNVNPFTPFFGTGRKGRIRGWGAWEVAFRWTFVDLTCRDLNPDNRLPLSTPNPITPPPVRQFGTLNESTLAINWWWNRSMRVQLNWIHSMPNYVGVGPVPFDIVGTRFQAEF